MSEEQTNMVSGWTTWCHLARQLEKASEKLGYSEDLLEKNSSGMNRSHSRGDPDLCQPLLIL